MSFKKTDGQLLKLATHRVAPEVTSAHIRKFLQSLDCPRSLTVWLMFVNNEHRQIAELGIDPLQYESVEEFRDAYAATKLLSKYRGLTTGLDLEAAALSKFKEFEKRCAQTNTRFRNLNLDSTYSGEVVWLHHAVKRKIQTILGAFKIEEVADRADWGPGASTLIKRTSASSANKFQFETGITRDLYALLFPDGDDALFRGVYPLWAQHLLGTEFPVYQVGNKVITVSKDSTTNRVIAVEPGFNLWFQKGIGEVIGRKLRRFGVDLRWQSRNQELARQASITLLNATVDFSSASDSISVELVRELLPPDWFSVMDSCRSHFGSIGETSLKWEKFSSMGNGFTFQLESLIFFAVAVCCLEYVGTVSTKEAVSAYGDDVIVPVRCLPLFSRVSEFYGFLINKKKTHFASTFRESCGAHFMRGRDVKPIYLKDRLSTISALFRAANSVRRFAHWGLISLGCDKRFLAPFYHLVYTVPKHFRFRISEQLGDGGFVSNFDEASPSRARHCIQGYFVKHLVSTSLTSEVDGVGLLLARLRVLSFQQESNTIPVRGRTRVRVVRSLVSQWYDLGPWL